jgi:hypothetical protein
MHTYMLVDGCDRISPVYSEFVNPIYRAHHRPMPMATGLLLQDSAMHVLEGATYVSYPARVPRTGCKPLISLIPALLTCY